MRARSARLSWVIPALPAFGAVVLLLFGKRIGEPRAGWFATGMMALDVRGVVRRVPRAAGRSRPKSAALRVATASRGSRSAASGRLPVPRRSALDDDDPLRHGRRHADPPVLDRVHARRPALHAVLRVPQPVRGLDARARARLELPRHLPRLGGRRALLVPARSRSGSSGTRPRSRARRRSSPTASATSGSCSRCS